MAKIAINEISQNYTYNIGTSSFATIALPITASWGPAFEDPASLGITLDEELEAVRWLHYPATQAGLEAFVSAYRGPASNYRVAKDYSYQMAMTLMTAGYDVLVCRLCPGTKASINIYLYDPPITEAASGTTPSSSTLAITAKYPGTFGNNLKVVLSKVPNRVYWNLVAYVVDASGVQTAVENLTFVFDMSNATDTIPHISEITSKFFDFFGVSNFSDTSCGLNLDPSTHGPTYNTITATLSGGTDIAANAASAAAAITAATASATARYAAAGYVTPATCEYVSVLSAITTTDENWANTLAYNEWLYTNAFHVYGLLQDKLNYNPQRIISPGWDDQDICSLNGDEPQRIAEISPLHLKLMETAYYSRCGTAILDVPRSASRATVYDESATTPGYAQMLARYQSTVVDVNSVLYTSHSALVAPWGQYQYVGTGKQAIASPAFQALMIQRAMILNQSLQYEWALPTNRKHNLALGQLDYKVPKKLLDIWQKLEGVGVNVITAIPDLGTSLWGNSTLFEVPPATYQALANLSTRYLVNAVENIAYKCGMAITFQYNNEQAYNKFYAGVTPTLDTMKNVGAIDDYYVRMAADINGLDQVNANTVIGKIYLVINGVINDIYIDLIALPPGTDLNRYRA